ncbi:MAG: hypothetical protein R6T96_06405 [Longimicrobiales bacterium]
MEDLSVMGVMDVAQTLFVTWGMKVLGGLAVFIVGLVLAKSARGGVERAFQRVEMEATLEKFLASLIFYLVLVIAGVAALGMIGIQMASLVGGPS